MCDHGNGCKDREEKGYSPTSDQIRQYSRREFLKISALASAGAFGYLSLPGIGIVPSAWGAPPPERVVRVHAGSVQDWDFSSIDFYNHVNQSVMDDMFARGLTNLTGQANIVDAWRNVLVGYQPGHKIVLKLNLNSYDYNANQTCEMAYTVIESLKHLGVAAADMKVFDVVRVFPDYWRARWNSDVEYINHHGVEWDGNAQIYYPAIDTYHRIPTVLSQADHMINICLQKGHKGYVTGSMKNHFGSQEEPADLHISRMDNICTVAASPLIEGKTRLIVVEGNYMTWYHEGHPFEETWATDLFPAGISGHSSPNYMMLGTNVVAIDSVLGDIQNHERSARSELTWINDFIQMAAEGPYNLGPRDWGTLINNPDGWSEKDFHYNILDYISMDLPLADRNQIDAMNRDLKDGHIHWSQLQHLVERYNERL
jgi:hypothetical protein